ncbi:tyrosine-type recombinase/integrase [Acinetobacter sp. ANC 4631]
MATFQKRNNRVTATVRIKPHSPKSKTFDTMRDAKVWAQELEVKLRNEKNQIFDHIILKDALVQYREEVSSKKKGAKQEIVKINFILKNIDCNVPLSSITKEKIVKWREERLKVVKGATVRRNLVVLAGFFTWCVEVKFFLSESPLKGVKFPKESEHRERTITDLEIEIMSSKLEPRLNKLFLFALETGMRQSEICDLYWERVFIEKRFIKLITTKNGRPREVPLSARAIEILKEIGLKKVGSVFDYTASEVSTGFRNARIDAGLDGFTFHDTRHTAATRIALKIPLLDLCKMFGWSEPKRAMVYYNPTASEIALRL